MIYVANDVGSKEYATAIRRRVHVPVEVTEMDAADFAFAGHGPTGRAFIGMERKTIGDMLSSMRSHRYAGFQVPNMSREYEVCYLIIEGVWRPNSDGVIEVPRKIRGKYTWLPYQDTFSAKHRKWQSATVPYMYSEVDKHICTLELQKNIIVLRSSSQSEMVQQVVNRYEWWQKRWDEHHSGDPIKLQAEVSFRRISWCEKFASILPGVGPKKAKQVGAYFKTIQAACTAPWEDWTEIPGIGERSAKEYYQLVRGEK